MLKEYLEARKLYCGLKLDLEEALMLAIRTKAGGKDPEVIRDIFQWTDGSIRILVNDFEFKNPRHLFFTEAEVEEAIAKYHERLGR